MPARIYRQPWSSDKSASWLVIRVRMCVSVCCAPCCVDSDKGGGRGLKKLIKSNDAMCGDSAVCVLIKKLPHFSAAGEETVENCKKETECCCGAGTQTEEKNLNIQRLKTGMFW